MSYRWSGRVGALVLGSITAVTACGSRDNLFVLDDEPTSGGGQAGDLSSGGRAGSISFSGYPNAAGGSTTFPTGGASFAGSSSGGHAFGGSSSVAGFGNVGNVGGSSMDWCAACLEQNQAGNQCALFECDYQHLDCALVPQNEGLACSDGNLCDQSACESGKCVPVSSVTCARSECSAGTCDPKTGTCVTSAVAGACDDGDPCTVKDECLGGKCVGGAAVACGINNDKCCPAGCSANLDNDCSPPAQVLLISSDRGWYESNGFHNTVNKNTFTGFSQGIFYNSFFNFDLSQVKGTIVAAQLSVYEESYFGTDMSQTVSIWDVTESPSVISSTTSSVAIYNDLQSGNRYGSLSVAPGLIGTNVTATLSATAIAALNAARGASVSVGLHVDTLSAMPTADEGVRFSSDVEPRNNELILSVQ